MSAQPDISVGDNGWGPDRRRAAVVVTLDNLGGVAAQARGDAPTLGTGGAPLSIEILPHLLRLLGGQKLTYFVEGANCELFPQAVKSIRDAGHDIGVHAWRHETWAQTPPGARRSILQRAIEAFNILGVDVAGFRPPGGDADIEQTRIECMEAGLRYMSPLGVAGACALTGSFVNIPFAWRHVDAYVLSASMSAVRQHNGDPGTAFPFAYWQETVDRALDDVKRDGRLVTLIFHPDVLGRDERYLSLFERLVRKIGDDRNIWAPTCAALAEWAASVPASDVAATGA